MDFKNQIVYQIWPRSFKDSNNDGIGDIQGIISKLDYLQDLGITLLWVSPLYASPNDDYGYDISDYYSINPEYGTMDDLDQLIQEAKKRNIAILMDLVANHTSTKHSWFQKALLNDPHYRNYYYFKTSENGKEPNNWLSFFGGSAWSKEEGKPNSYFLTTFTPTQADLDWRNPNVREEIYQIMRFYLDKGIAGFRMDVINTIDKKDGLPSYQSENKGYQLAVPYIIDGPRVEEYLKEMHERVLAPYNAISLAEGCLISVDKAMAYTKPENKEIDMTFHFDLAMLGYGELGKYDPRKLYRFKPKDIKAITRKWQNAMMKQGGYIGNYISNHDHKRPAGRYFPLQYRTQGAKCFALYNFALYGTPFIYQGEEIGMGNAKLKRGDWKDYESFNSVKALKDMIGVPNFIGDKIATYVTRDNARTPMQWNKQQNAGFSTHTPWIKLNEDYETINVEDAMKDPHSIWHFYKRLIELRKNHSALVEGTFHELHPEHPYILCFERIAKEEELLVILNLSKKHTAINIEEINDYELLLSNYPDSKLDSNLHLRPFEAILLKHK